MQRLYIVRHGIAVERGSPEYRDDERPLTPKGERRIEQIAKRLRRLRIEPDRILTSPLPRARRTAELVAEPLGLRERLEEADALRADRDAESIRDWLDGLGGDSAMIVGHNPSLSDLVALLLLGDGAPPCFDLKKGGVAALETAGPGRYRLDWLATPGLLRR